MIRSPTVVPDWPQVGRSRCLRCGPTLRSSDSLVAVIRSGGPPCRLTTF